MNLMIFGRLRAGSEKDRREHLFRIFGYGSIILLLGFLWFSFFFQSSKWSNAVGDKLVHVVLVIVVSGLTALTVLSWLQTEEETSGQTLLAVIKLWPVLALCLPSLLGLGLPFLLFLSRILLKSPAWPSVDLFSFFWLLFVAPFATVIAFIVFVRRSWTDRVALFPALLACAMLFASVVANLIALIALIFAGGGSPPM
jgi:hypothetical protein